MVYIYLINIFKTIVFIKLSNQISENIFAYNNSLKFIVVDKTVMYNNDYIEITSKPS